MISKRSINVVALTAALALLGGNDSEAIFGKKKNISSKKSTSGEYIIISGGPALREWEDLRKKKYQHDRWWGNFIRPARVRIQELRKDFGENYEITWLVYKPSYEARASEDKNPLISWIESVEKKYNVNLLWIKNGGDIINHINEGRDRRKKKIDGFEYYGHSNRHAFLIEYSNEIIGASTVCLHENELRKIDRRSFNKRANCVSYGCNTGESMAKKWRQATGVKMRAAIGKTDYSNPLKPVIVPPGYWNDSKFRLKRLRR
ncbi:MAG: hypothetical protein CMO38_00405 [Verrucomicrobiaceae bacterium]|nr:hypothetical protein [Verrucomicrobiaceae bacterium]